MTQRFMAYNADHLRMVAEMIEALPEDKHATFAAMLITQRLMVFEDEALEAVAEVARAGDRCFIAMTTWFDLHPEAADELLMQAASHCMYGRDTIDDDSVGGWGQVELDKVATLLMVHNRQTTAH
ncbi:hypothetical protein ACQKOE_07440 [Novosphingobium sp. NPDC080210]|uniref:hypothetical protein n=1 Tax=Novosphingobium sp. NPDC080210 TaxID=3390596 RepID=UPI003D04DF6A